MMREFERPTDIDPTSTAWQRAVATVIHKANQNWRGGVFHLNDGRSIIAAAVDILHLERIDEDGRHGLLRLTYHRDNVLEHTIVRTSEIERLAVALDDAVIAG